ncbi:hypothetical protein KKH39_04155 [Patescibacteria group bacterium]|nr:hypothetical protein [Patescibacteria group bacterium]
MYAVQKYPKIAGVGWPDFLLYFKDKRLLFLAEDKKLRDNGEKLFIKYVLNKKRLKKLYKDWILILKKFNYYEKIINRGFDNYSNKEFIKFFISWYDFYEEFWLKSWLPELGNWGGERLLKNKVLERYPKNYLEILESLPAPEKSSFYQKEEFSLLKIKLLKNKKDIEIALVRHAKKYYWLANSYFEVRVLDKKYFKNRLSKISQAGARKKLKEIENYSKKIKSDKKNVIKKFKINSEIVSIANGVAYCLWWQDYRKQYILISDYFINEFIKEISKRLKISLQDLYYYSYPDLITLLKKGKVVDTKKRKMALLSIYKENNGYKHIDGKQALKIIKPFLAEQTIKGVDSVKGLVISRGRGNVSSRARILFGIKEINKMKQGEILITTITTPEFIVAMRKAKAIVTDEGGLTSHAAIVSRELGIPCVVATKNATKIFKTGDKIKIDIKTGLCKKI